MIAAVLGLMAPNRCLGLVLEAFHYDRQKLHSREFFETMVSEPDSFGERVAEVLKRAQGESYWRELLCCEGQSWLDIARSATPRRRDLFDGTLSNFHVPTVVIQGAKDPRTERWELDAVAREIPMAESHVIASGGHSPHSESASAQEFSALLLLALARFSRDIDTAAL